MSRLVCWLAAVILFPPLLAFGEDRLVWNEIIQVPAGQMMYKPFTVPLPLINGRLAGSYQAAGGAGNDITFRVLDADAYKALTARSSYIPLYAAERRRSDVVSVPIRNAGTYYIIFDNGFSIVSTKQVKVELRLVYDGEDRELATQLAKQEDERVKQLGAILGKLTEALQAKERILGTRQIKPPIRFGIIEDKSINAFALPDRNIIAVNRGLVNFSESVGVPEMTTAILAGVLSHELAHVFYRHSSGNIQAQNVQAVGAGATAGYFVHPLVGLLVGALAIDQHRAYDRMEEREADLLGIQVACEAGYDPLGSLVLMQRFARESSGIDFLRTHPSPQNREEYLRTAALSCLKPQSQPAQPTTSIVQPEALYRPDPPYTAEARRSNIRGTVAVEFTIGVDGRAHDVKVVKGLGFGLDESAIQTIETLWRFKPGQKDGQPVPAHANAEITFRP